jgi:serine protease Do
MQAVIGVASAGVIAISSFMGGHKIPNLYNRAVPSVVYIESVGSTRNPMDVSDGGGRLKVVQGIGSGFAVKKKGVVSPVRVEVVTNYHVIADSEKIRVVIHGVGVDARLIAADVVNDLALLEIETDRGLDPLPLCSLGAGVEIGESVVAIGSPFGLEGSISEGIVSGKDREIGAAEGVLLIQTDAAINPGNSGGPLISVEDGCVLGVNTATIGGSSGIGFAVPVDRVRELMEGI